jgi:hypothetical protein
MICNNSNISKIGSRDYKVSFWYRAHDDVTTLFDLFHYADFLEDLEYQTL